MLYTYNYIFNLIKPTHFVHIILLVIYVIAVPFSWWLSLLGNDTLRAETCYSHDTKKQCAVFFLLWHTWTMTMTYAENLYVNNKILVKYK
jgi:hypothetical protein